MILIITLFFYCDHPTELRDNPYDPYHYNISVTLPDLNNEYPFDGEITLTPVIYPDNSLSEINFYLDNELIDTNDKPPFQILFNSANYPDGIHSISFTGINSYTKKTTSISGNKNIYINNIGIKKYDSPFEDLTNWTDIKYDSCNSYWVKYNANTVHCYRLQIGSLVLFKSFEINTEKFLAISMDIQSKFTKSTVLIIDGTIENPSSFTNTILFQDFIESENDSKKVYNVMTPETGTITVLLKAESDDDNNTLGYSSFSDLKITSYSVKNELENINNSN